MTQYKFLATDLITGAILCDSLPLEVQSFSQQLNGGGTLTGALDLSERYTDNRPFLEALTCCRSVIWVLADGYPVWCGGLWDEPDSTRAQGNLPISCQTMDYLFSKRLIKATLEYPQVDIFTVFLDLLRYGTTKTSPYITTLSPVQGPPSPLVAQACHVAGLVLPTGKAALAGSTWSAGYLYSDHTSVADAWSALTQAGNLEYVFQPGLDSSGNLAIFVLLGFSQLGRGYLQTGYSATFPGNALDYGKQITGSQSSNAVTATAPPNGSAVQWESQYPHGYDLAALQAGFPLLETAVQWQGSTVTQQSQIDSFADGQLGIVSQSMTTPVITLGGSGQPSILDLVLGDTFQFAATSAVDPPVAPGAQPGWTPLLRLTGWTVTPPGPQQSEQVQLQTSQILATP